MNIQSDPKKNTEETNPQTEQDKALNPDIRKEENKAGEKWEKVKDNTSGVDKELEKKLEEGTVEPKDLDTQGG